MADIQDECFWFYNNALFSENDFENIIKIGGGHKAKKKGVIGKFGLGFNAVYNISDFPSIMSGDKLAMFDPNLKYLPSQQQGIIINIEDEKDYLSRYKDQMRPYFGIFGCEDIFNGNKKNKKKFHYNGTLFRLPFRKTESELSNILYNKERSKNIIKIFFENAENLIMYTQNVCKIEFYTLSDDCEAMNLFFLIEKSGVEFIRKYDSDFEITRLCTDENRQLIKQSNILNLTAHLLQTNVQNLKKEIIFIQKIKVSLSKSKIFPDFKEKSFDSFWFQSIKCFPKLSESHSTPFENILPCVAVSFKIISNDAKNPIKYSLDRITKYGSLFCFLPLPVETHLNFNANGNFFLNSSREDVICSSIDRLETIESKWNENLQIYLASTLRKCCEVMADYVEYDISDLMGLWPIETKLLKLEKEFYQQIFDYNLKSSIFKYKTKKYTIDTCIVLNLTFNEYFNNLAKNVYQNIIGQDFCVIVLPNKILKHLKENKIVLRNQIDDYQFCEILILNIHKISIEVVLEIIKYLLSEYACEKDGTLTKIGLFMKNKQFLPTNLNGIIKKPNELVSNISIIGTLYDAEIDDVFPNNQIFKNNKEVLVKMGLISDYLPSFMILERINKLLSNTEVKISSQLNCFNLVNNFILTLIKEEKNDSSTQFQNNIFEMKFVTAKFKKSTNKLIWYSDIDKDKLWALNDLYADTNEHFIFRVCPLFDSNKIDSQNRNSIELLNFKEANSDKYIEQFKELQKDWLNINNESIGFELYNYNLKFLEWLNINSNFYDLTNFPENALFFNLCNKYDYYSVNNVAFYVKYPTPPYLIELPTQFYTVTNILKKIGVLQKFSSNYLIDKLNEIYLKNKYEVIDTATVELCINITKELDLACDINSIRENIYLPDTNMILRPSNDLCFQDKTQSWLKSANHHVIHDKITVDVAKKLGIISLQSSVTKALVQGFCFGQKEPLVRRIKRLLESYPHFFDVFKELVQNADDAGASVISFILDNRNHKCKKLFTKEFSALQGPALCCYNNKIFTENDLEALKSLGVGNKENQISQTGKYGVGFNCIYRLTDAPQLISN